MCRANLVELRAPAVGRSHKVGQRGVLLLRGFGRFEHHDGQPWLGRDAYPYGVGGQVQQQGHDGRR
jgi:hypothetical protein